jgi:hypothetical protein
MKAAPTKPAKEKYSTIFSSSRRLELGELEESSRVMIIDAGFVSVTLVMA